MDAKDIKLTTKNADACNAIDRGTSNLETYFNMGEELDVELDTILDGIRALKLTKTNTNVYKKFKALRAAVDNAANMIDEFNTEWQAFYEDIPG